MYKRPLPGMRAPALSLPLAGGGTYDLAAQSPATATMLIFYRGLHCPICKDYLGRVAKMADQFTENGMPIVLASMDPRDRAEEAKRDWNLGDIPIAYDMTEEKARQWGLYISSSIKESETKVFSEAGLFWILPDNTLYMAEIASAPFARPSLDILAAKVGLIKSGYPPRGAKS